MPRRSPAKLELVQALLQQRATEEAREAEEHKKLEANRVAALVAETGDLLTEKPPEHESKKAADKGWWPRGGPVARQVFNSTAKYNLVFGERLSGKTVACLHRIVRHCYDNDNALAVIVTLVRKAATFGGPWEEVEKHILPEWAEGIGLQGEGPNGEFLFRRDQGSQTPFVWIGTRHGGWSRIILISLQHGEQIAGKIKNMQFSLFFFDEITNTPPGDVGERFFLDPIQQLRRRGVSELIYLAACNPADEGEDHWVYKRWLGEKQHNPIDYRAFHLPIKENIWYPKVDEYLAAIYEEGKLDPTAIERKIHGRWVAMPKGDGIYKQQFHRDRHVRGNVEKRIRIYPSTAWRIIKIGMDPGPVNFAASFMQQPPNSEGKRLYGIFDELVHINTNVPYPNIVVELLKKMNFWCEVMETPFIFQVVADSAAFSQARTDGTYEARKLQELSAEELKKHPERYPALGHMTGIRIRPCPKPPGSIVDRVSMVRTKLDTDEIVVSATCTKHVQMLLGLESDKAKGPAYPLKNIRGLIHIHDAMSYAMYYDELGCFQVKPAEREKSATPDFLAIG